MKSCFKIFQKLEKRKSTKKVDNKDEKFIQQNNQYPAKP